jgi:beta-glucosidase
MVVPECRRISETVAHQFRLTSARSALESAERVFADGPMTEHELDAAVRGVLAAKHALGLFRDSQRVVAPPTARLGYARDDHRVRSTFVLLRNEAGLLPLSPVSDRVVVVGSADGCGAACADALGRAGIGHALAPGLAQRRPGESWAAPVPGDHFALSLACDAARRADFALVVLEDQHFSAPESGEWRKPTPGALAMLRGLALSGARQVAIIATREPVDLADADQHFAAVLQCWQPVAGFEEALCDVLSGRFSPQGRMPASAGRYLAGHGLGFGESVLSGYSLTVAGSHVEASVRVCNSGSFAMRETVQLYLRDGSDQLRLIGFRHAMLAPGSEERVSFELGLDALGTPAAGGRLELPPGRYEILAGKSRSRLLAASVEIPTAVARAMILREYGFLRLAAG